MSKQKLVVLTGAGMSAESGIPTFRGSDGLWEGFRIEEVASPEGWKRNRLVVLDFYNQRRKAIMAAKPNRGHEILAELQEKIDVQIITQNIDNLHERAGSKKVLHLHGEIMKARSTTDERLVYDLSHWEIKEGELCEKGSQLRPHIVWFGEAVPMMDDAIDLVSDADLLVIVGTSMVVYPAASLIHFAADDVPVYCIDPVIPPLPKRKLPIVGINKGGSEGLELLLKMI
jgi:NAD-dependent deacetylase